MQLLGPHLLRSIVSVILRWRRQDDEGGLTEQAFLREVYVGRGLVGDVAEEFEDRGFIFPGHLEDLEGRGW
jgi:hypothetical protein